MADAPSPSTFAGRTEEIDRLTIALREASVRVMALVGPHGIGKTAIAHQLFQNAEQVLPGRFSRCLWQSCWQETWSSLMSMAALKLLGRTALTLPMEAIERAIIEAASQESLLIVLDNAESTHREDLRRFLSVWTGSQHTSVVLMTTAEPSLAMPSQHTSLTHEMSGLPPEQCLELFGDALRAHFGDKHLTQVATRLKGVPLDLLYIRWMSPASKEALENTVSHIVSGAFDASVSIENVLSTLTRSPTHFMALGVINRLEFDERLLGFFWDMFCSGSVEAYADHQASLIESRLLIPVSDQGGSVFRVSEQAHKHLRKALERRLGGERGLAIVHYYASEYYRRALERRTPPPDALRAFVAHSIQSGECDRAYRYLFEHRAPSPEKRTSAGLEVLRQPFLELESSTALQLREILGLFLGPRVSKPLNKLRQATVLAELAHVTSDLSLFDECLKLTERVTALLGPENYDARELYRRVWYYSAVSLYNTGQARACAECYFRILGSGGDDTLGTLSLGYLAHSLVMFDIGAALQFGEEAVSLARQSTADIALLAKNLASHAETLTCAKLYDDAEARFSEAADICRGRPESSTTIRELGRLLGSWAALSLAQKDYSLAIERSEEAMLHSARMGDIRRVACARQYRAIAYKALGRDADAIAEMGAATKQVEPSNRRYTIPPLLTLAKWRNNDFGGSLAELESLDLGNELGRYVRGSNHESLAVYGSYWTRYYWPRFCSEDG